MRLTHAGPLGTYEDADPILPVATRKVAHFGDPRPAGSEILEADLDLGNVAVLVRRYDLDLSA